MLVGCAHKRRRRPRRRSRRRRPRATSCASRPSRATSRKAKVTLTIEQEHAAKHGDKAGATKVALSFDFVEEEKVDAVDRRRHGAGDRAPGRRRSASRGPGANQQHGRRLRARPRRARRFSSSRSPRGDVVVAHLSAGCASRSTRHCARHAQRHLRRRPRAHPARGAVDVGGTWKATPPRCRRRSAPAPRQATSITYVCAQTTASPSSPATGALDAPRMPASASEHTGGQDAREYTVQRRRRPARPRSSSGRHQSLIEDVGAGRSAVERQRHRRGARQGWQAGRRNDRAASDARVNRRRERPPRDITPQRFFTDWLPREFATEFGAGKRAASDITVAVHLEGDGGGHWILDVKGGVLAVRARAAPARADRSPAPDGRRLARAGRRRRGRRSIWRRRRPRRSTCCSSIRLAADDVGGQGDRPLRGDRLQRAHLVDAGQVRRAARGGRRPTPPSPSTPRPTRRCWRARWRRPRPTSPARSSCAATRALAMQLGMAMLPRFTDPR